MATIVSGRVPAEEFALSETLTSLSDGQFEVERIVESVEDTVMPLLWVYGIDDDRITSLFADDPSVEDVSLLSAFEDEQLYRMEWVSKIELVFHILTEAGAAITDVVSKDENWYLRVLFPTREGVNQTKKYCDENDLTFDILSIHEMQGESAGRYGLTEIQHRALTTAAEEGYYHVPRDVTMEELVSDLDVSHQAFSERLRRAIDSLVANTVLVDSPPRK
jgi:predicted DNA binding protein